MRQPLRAELRFVCALGDETSFRNASTRVAPRARARRRRSAGRFLTDIGYLLPVEELQVHVQRVDRQIAEFPGPQLLVPSTVPRWG
jgi:hypothetical protein